MLRSTNLLARKRFFRPSPCTISTRRCGYHHVTGSHTHNAVFLYVTGHDLRCISIAATNVPYLFLTAFVLPYNLIYLYIQLYIIELQILSNTFCRPHYYTQGIMFRLMVVLSAIIVLHGVNSHNFPKQLLEVIKKRATSETYQTAGLQHK